MKPKYYFFYLEVALKKKTDTNIYVFTNLSHIPTKKLIGIFNIDQEKDPFILEGYFLTKTIYRKHKKFIDSNFGAINLNVFEYCLRQYAGYDYKSVRKKYKRDLME